MWGRVWAEEGRRKGHMRRRNITYNGHAEAYLSEGFDVPQVDIMWGAKFFLSLRSRIFTQTFRRLWGGDGGNEREAAEGKGRGNAQTKFFPIHKSCLCTRGGGLHGNCSTHHRERFHFHLKMH